ncbi:MULTISPECIES: response regulator transcription factor [Pseudomonas]|jgi:two-component system response regulator EvgA|uniref:response regulator transcription factor n=1 Tax=Pseudomonas TaxID=286 RepID=UPI000D9BB924|nr:MULTISPECIES: response regulator transcription factor [Pseudomonas]MCE0915836.1 response regulator transcription factor [Pseudomonas sp. NMI760_13]MCP8632101.1 response regulator transcription factor [Pseudomonas sp. DVZ6]MDD7783069.1 response regulator transcription factor [Pseudomonas sp. DVZ24]PYC21687.1 DNA-binding response regulator [Pseudomonas mosselii]
MSITVLIVDDHPIFSSAISAFLEQTGYNVVGECTDGIEALASLRRLSPDYLILDIGLDGLDGLSVLQRIHAENLPVKTLVFTSQMAATYASRCMQAGASGFINKSATLDDLLRGLKTIQDGYLYFPKDVLSHYMDFNPQSDNGTQSLTNKEMLILQLLAQGLSNMEIAERLHLSHKTISGHKVNILRKLGVRTTIELADIARDMNLI